MDRVELGRTGLKVAVAGLGAGGFSRLGLSSGASDEEAANVVRAALDEGVNLIDTAAVYGTEKAVGLALKGRRREDVVVSTKSLISDDGKPRPVADIIASLDTSLQTLDVDCVDIFHLHAVRPHHYDFALNDVLPALEREREKGKYRHIGITETSPHDLEHDALRKGLEDDTPWRVMMLAHNMMHQSAATTLYPHTRRLGIGTLVMFAVRRIFANPEMLSDEISRRIAKGELSADDVDASNPLGFLLESTGTTSLTEAAYRFCRHEPGADVVLFGTGSVDHVRDNVRALAAPALPAEDVARIRKVFGSLVGVGIELPTRTT